MHINFPENLPVFFMKEKLFFSVQCSQSPNSTLYIYIRFSALNFLVWTYINYWFFSPFETYSNFFYCLTFFFFLLFFKLNNNERNVISCIKRKLKYLGMKEENSHLALLPIKNENCRRDEAFFYSSWREAKLVNLSIYWDIKKRKIVKCW